MTSKELQVAYILMAVTLTEVGVAAILQHRMLSCLACFVQVPGLKFSMQEILFLLHGQCLQPEKVRVSTDKVCMLTTGQHQK